jgi:tyrosyl-tRNA synthetase
MNGMNKEMDGTRMSSSQPSVHLSPINTRKQIKDKIGRSFCQPGNLEGNVSIQWARDVIFRLGNEKRKFYLSNNFYDFLAQTIERSEKNGGNLVFNTPDELDQLFASEQLHPGDLKEFVTQKLDLFLEPIRAAIDPRDLSKMLKEISLNSN